MCKYYCQVHFFSNRLYSKFKQFVVKSNPISFKGAVFFLCVICPSNSNRILRLAMQCVFSSLSFSFVVYGGPLILTRSFKMTNYSCFHDSTKKSGEATSGQRHPKTRLNFILDLKLYNQIILNALKSENKIPAYLDIYFLDTLIFAKNHLSKITNIFVNGYQNCL